MTKRAARPRGAMRALLLAVPLLLVASAVVVPEAQAAPPCPPDACCKGPVECLTYGVRRLLAEVGFADECFYTPDGYTCVSYDPRSSCIVYQLDASGWRCVL